LDWYKKYEAYGWVLLLVPIYLFIFLKIGSFHARLWDEGWFAVHAYEMWERGSLLVSYYNGVPDHFGSKPPLQTWLQIFMIQFFGYSETTLRIPSAAAAGATVLLLFFFTRKHFGELIAWTAAMVLLTTYGFIHFHTARGMEADSLLTLVLFSQVILGYRVTQGHVHSILWLGVMLGLGFLTKSVAGFLMIPGLVIYYLVYERQLVASLLRSRLFYSAVGITLGMTAGYLLIREWAQPGFFQFILERNAGRYVETVGHDEPFWFYLERLKNLHSKTWTWTYPSLVGLLLPLLPFVPKRKVQVYISIISLSFFLVISLSKSKLFWYMMPLYPLLALSAASILLHIPQRINRKFVVVALVLIFAAPGYRMFAKSQNNAMPIWDKEYEAQEMYLFRAFNRLEDMSEVIIIHNHFDGALLFYKYKFKEIGQHLHLQNTFDLEAGDRVLIRGDEMKEKLMSLYDVEKIDHHYTATLYTIIQTR